MMMLGFFIQGYAGYEMMLFDLNVSESQLAINTGLQRDRQSWGDVGAADGGDVLHACATVPRGGDGHVPPVAKLRVEPLHLGGGG